MKSKLSLLAFLMALVALGVVFLRAPSSASIAAKKETSFERIVRTGTIRCGYAVAAPELMKDSEGKLSGYDYEVANEMGKVLGLKVEWVEEVAWGAVEQGLETGRYDMACNGYWAHPPRAKGAVFSRPFIHHPLFPIVRGTLEVPEEGYAWLNNPRYTMAVLNGTIGDLVAQRYFPAAKVVDASVIASEGDFFMNLAMGKADFSFGSLPMVKTFMEQNPGKIRVLPVQIEITNGAFLLARDDWRLKGMVDKALDYLLDSGRVRDIMIQYMGDDPGAWRLPATNYEK